jgi:hypothetical protein
MQLASSHSPGPSRSCSSSPRLDFYRVTPPFPPVSPPSPPTHRATWGGQVFPRSLHAAGAPTLLERCSPSVSSQHDCGIEATPVPCPPAEQGESRYPLKGGRSTVDSMSRMQDMENSPDKESILDLPRREGRYRDLSTREAALLDAVEQTLRRAAECGAAKVATTTLASLSATPPSSPREAMEPRMPAAASACSDGSTCSPRVPRRTCEVPDLEPENESRLVTANALARKDAQSPSRRPHGYECSVHPSDGMDIMTDDGQALVLLSPVLPGRASADPQHAALPRQLRPQQTLECCQCANSSLERTHCAHGRPLQTPTPLQSRPVDAAGPTLAATTPAAQFTAHIKSPMHGNLEQMLDVCRSSVDTLHVSGHQGSNPADTLPVPEAHESDSAATLAVAGHCRSDTRLPCSSGCDASSVPSLHPLFYPASTALADCQPQDTGSHMFAIVSSISLAQEAIGQRTTGHRLAGIPSLRLPVQRGAWQLDGGGHPGEEEEPRPWESWEVPQLHSLSHSSSVSPHASCSCDERGTRTAAICR